MKIKYDDSNFYTDNKYLSERIRLVRKFAHISSHVCADDLGISYDTYRLLEQGRISPIPYFQAFSNYYGSTLTIAMFSVDWSLYTGNKLRTYLGHYCYNRVRAAIVEFRV